MQVCTLSGLAAKVGEQAPSGYEAYDKAAYRLCPHVTKCSPLSAYVDLRLHPRLEQRFID